jgi:hypothetical protein
LDRAEGLAERIEADGVVVHSRTAGLRSHPAIKDETARTAIDDASKRW